MDIKELLQNSAQKLKKNPACNNFLEARLIIAHVLEIDANKIAIIDNLLVNDQQVRLINNMVEFKGIGQALGTFAKQARILWRSF